MKYEIGKYYYGFIGESNWIFKVTDISRTNYCAAQFICGHSIGNYFVLSNNPSFCTHNTFNISKHVRDATPEEIKHLEQCISAGKYIDYIPDTIKENYQLY